MNPLGHLDLFWETFTFTILSGSQNNAHDEFTTHVYYHFSTHSSYPFLFLFSHLSLFVTPGVSNTATSLVWFVAQTLSEPLLYLVMACDEYHHWGAGFPLKFLHALNPQGL